MTIYQIIYHDKVIAELLSPIAYQMVARLGLEYSVRVVSQPL